MKSTPLQIPYFDGEATLLFPLDFKFQFAIFLKLAEKLISFLHTNI